MLREKTFWAWARLAALAMAAATIWSHNAFAETVSWQRPTTYVDGSALPATAITGYEIRCSAAGTATIVSCATVSAPGTATSVTLAVTVTQAGGTICAEGRAFAGAANPSVWNSGPNAVCKTVPATPPGPPTNITVAFTVTIGGRPVVVDPVPVYAINSAGNKGSAVVGWMPAGRPAGERVFDYKGLPYCRVDRADVGGWAGSVPNRVAAACSIAS